MSKAKMAKQVSEYQTRVYALLQQIPEGKITTYAALARALDSSPRAVGGALRNNPFAPEIPCHRCIASTGVSCLRREIRRESEADGTESLVHRRLPRRLEVGTQRNQHE